jgi:hypothetical protein
LVLNENGTWKRSLRLLLWENAAVAIRQIVMVAAATDSIRFMISPQNSGFVLKAGTSGDSHPVRLHHRIVRKPAP